MSDCQGERTSLVESKPRECNSTVPTTCGMFDNERKSFVWTIKKGLHSLTTEEIFQLTQSIGPVDELETDKLDKNDEQSCFEYLSAYMSSNSLLMLEDEGISWLLDLKDKVDEIIEDQSKSPET